jgi:hypothetical protein
MKKLGISNVRWWMFSSVNLSDNEYADAFRWICEKFDLCRPCGKLCTLQTGASLGASTRGRVEGGLDRHRATQPRRSRAVLLSESESHPIGIRAKTAAP